MKTLSTSPGIGGKIKQQPEDFLVEEILPDGKIAEADKPFSQPGSEGDFTHFILQKKNWNTMQALTAIGDTLRVGPKRFSYAGMKDRAAITTQRCSAWKIEKEKLLDLRVKDIKILGAWGAAQAVELGDLLGNRFTIIVKGAAPDSEVRVAKILSDLHGKIPNYFGEQRFGSVRANTHLIGKEIIKGNFWDAVWHYLTDVEESEIQEAREARKRLSREQDFAAALQYFPHHLKFERRLLAHLADAPKDAIGALRKLPRGLALMFIHAYQSHLFNKVLEKAVEKAREGGKTEEHGNLIGYETKELSEYEKELLAEEGIDIQSFHIKSFPEISSKGATRPFFIGLRDFEFNAATATFKFSLPAGSYATVVMEEFMRVDK